MRFLWLLDWMDDHNMGEEEQDQKSCYSAIGVGIGAGSAARSSKKQKQKKVPQRGLGVAQLEKIRLEEEHKNDSPSIVTLSSSPSTSAPRRGFSDPDTLAATKGTVPLANTQKNGGLEIPATRYDMPSWCRDGRKAWNFCEHSKAMAVDGCRIDPGYALRSSLHVPDETDHLWPLLGLPRYHPPPPVVNAPATPSSFVPNFQTEPPSNQKYHGDYSPIFQEEEKISGSKRSCPFSSENLPVFPVHLKLLATANATGRLDEQASYARGVELIYEPGSAYFRSSSSPSSVSEPSSVKSKRQNANAGEFLTLGLSTSISTWPSKIKQPLALTVLEGQETTPYELECHQLENMEGAKLPSGYQMNQQRNYYSLRPLEKTHINEGIASAFTSDNGAIDASVDLTLKL